MKTWQKWALGIGTLGIGSLLAWYLLKPAKASAQTTLLPQPVPSGGVAAPRTSTSSGSSRATKSPVTYALASEFKVVMPRGAALVAQTKADLKDYEKTYGSLDVSEADIQIPDYRIVLYVPSSRLRSMPSQLDTSSGRRYVQIPSTIS